MYLKESGNDKGRISTLLEKDELLINAIKSMG
jgi:hypothetical protein